MRRRMLVLFVLSVLVFAPIAAQQTATKPSPQVAPAAAPAQKPDATPAAPAAPRPMELADIIAWKNIGATAVANDGKWFAYRMSPMEGDSEVFIRATDADTVYKFPAGEAPSMAGGPAPGGPGEAGPPSSSLGFSPDSKWAAFTAYPSRAEGQRLRRQRRPVQAKMQLVDLATGKDVSIENVRRFAFAGERGGWVAVAKAPASAGGPGAGAAPPSAPAAGSGAAAAAPDRPKGSDLILRDLATGRDFNIGNVAEFAFDKSGRYLALVIDAPDKAGNGVQLRDMETGVVSVLDSDKASYERLAWTREGDGLAVLKGTEDKRFTDKVYARGGLHRVRCGTRAAARGVRPRLGQDVPGGHVDQPESQPGVDRGPLGARLRHPHPEEVGRETRHSEAWRGRRRPDGEARSAGGSGRARDAGR